MGTGIRSETRGRQRCSASIFDRIGLGNKEAPDVCASEASAHSNTAKHMEQTK